MTTRVLIANLIAVLQVTCLTLSTCAPTRRKVYRLQLIECMLSLLIMVVLGAWSGFTTLIIAVYRNWRTMEDKFSAPEMVVTAALTVIIGLMVNTDGFIGLLPIIATVELTAFNHYAKGIRMTKIGILINIMMWGIYAFCLGNIVSGCGEAVSFTAGLISLIRLERSAVYSG
ncbi:MAG: YgjV family protein [Clostridium sp.]|nr:YgjV family protein [Clostridium sp.]